MKPNGTPRRAFAYSRFSTSEQKDGRSQKRQEEAVKSYCQRHGLTLDERAFSDLAISAYYGANAEVGELGVFMEMLKEGRIPKGSVLVVENLDRLTRLPDPEKATKVITSIVHAGVDVVTVSPETVYTKANIHSPSVWIPFQCLLALGAEESRKKSERVGDAWAAKRETAGDIKLTKRAPIWLKLTADRRGWMVIPSVASAVRRVFALALEGHGTVTISKIMHKECPDGLTGRGWQPGYIAHLLHCRSVIGEYQPHAGTGAKKGRKSTRKPIGEPIKDYFPPIVSEADFYRVQAALAKRRFSGGRITGVPNLFTSILYDALDGRPMALNRAHKRRVLISTGWMRRIPGSEFRSIRYDLFERVVLSELSELKPADVTGRPGATEDRVAALSGQLTTINRKLASVTARAATDEDVTVFFDLLADLDRQRKAIIKQLEEAKQECASQQSDNLGEFKGLVALLDEVNDEERDKLRLKIRSALRRIVKEMRLLIVPRGRVRLANLQVYFADGKSYRSYMLIVRSPQANQIVRATGRYYVASVKHPDDGLDMIENHDLRNPGDADMTRRVLEEYPTDLIDRLLAGKHSEPLP